MKFFSGCLSLNLVLLLGSANGCKKEFPTPTPEHYEGTAKVTAPQPPAFKINKPADGSRGVKELRVRGKSLLDTTVRVRGYVTWDYDCVAAVQKSGENREAVLARIKEKPDLCDKRHFTIGDATSTTPELSLTVAGVPQTLREDQARSLTKAQIAEHEATVPSYQVGDEVLVTGKFTKSYSVKRKHGVIVFDAMENLTATPPAEAP